METKRASFLIAGVYLVLSLAWILFSDRLMFMMTEDLEALNRISNYKGYVFVFLSAILIWWLVFRALKHMEILNRDLTVALDTEQTLGEELVQRNADVEVAHQQLLHKNEALLQVQRNIRSMLYQDDWTHLPNRRALRNFLDRHVKHVPARPLVLMYLDLDNFKLLNDVHGHSRGDVYIREIAGRMQEQLGRQWRLYRMGGDEFVCCRPGWVEETELETVAVHLREACTQPVSVEGVSIHGSVSLGIARFPEHGDSAEDLLKHADIAMYAAKKAGRNLSALYDEHMAEPVNQRFRMEAALRVALERGEFHLVFQPQLALDSGTIRGFEALIRWQSADLGPVSPMEFIPVAEESRHILEIGEWVTRSACAFLAEVHAMGHKALCMAVNVSMLQLLQPEFADKVAEIALECGIAPSFLELEITESVLMESRERVLPVLHALQEKGFRVSLDDFGQGYSSLSYLMSMPIQVLKIDKRFVDEIGRPGPGEAVLGSILALGRQLQLQTVGEGVETEDQRDFLVRNGCDCLQGYWYSRPLTSSAAISLLSS